MWKKPMFIIFIIYLWLLSGLCLTSSCSFLPVLMLWWVPPIHTWEALIGLSRLTKQNKIKQKVGRKPCSLLGEDLEGVEEGGKMGVDMIMFHYIHI